MKRRSGVKVIAQRKGWDCGAACLAMLLSKPYGDVAAAVRELIDERLYRRRGLVISDVQIIAARFGVGLVAVRKRRGYLDGRAGILGMIGGQMDRAGHWVVLKAGAIVDPDGGEVWSVADYTAKHKCRPVTLLTEGA